MEQKPKILGYKIRRKTDGLYLGTGSVLWGKKGKVWTSLGYAIASIRSFLQHETFTEFELMDLEIVELAETKSYSTAYILDKL